MRGNEITANKHAVASMGGFGCKYYNVAQPETLNIEDVDDREKMYFAAVQAISDTDITSVSTKYDAPAGIGDSGFVLPMGQTWFTKATSITIAKGSGIIYLGGE